MPKIKYDKYLILGILIAFFFDSRVDSRTGDEERLSANVYEQKSMIEAVFMSSKKSTVAIKMLLTATRDRLSFILIQTQNCLNIWSHHTLSRGGNPHALPRACLPCTAIAALACVKPELSGTSR